MKTVGLAFGRACGMALAVAACFAGAAHAGGYEIWVSDEHSGEVTVIDAAALKPVATFAVGKRPRGIHAAPDGRSVYVALSGTPIEAPPQLDAAGNPILRKGADDDDEDEAKADKSADAIAVVDTASRKVVRRIYVGSDPEEFALSPDGTQLYVSNEDTKTASIVDIAAGKVQHIIPIGQEPEGVAVTRDGRQIYVTCEAGGDVYVVDARSFRTVAHFSVAPRPRSVEFLHGAPVGFIPSESAGLLNVIDTAHYTVLKSIALPAGVRPMRVRVSDDDSKLYVSGGRSGSVVVIDAHSDAVLGSITVGKRPWGIVLSPDGRYLFSANGPSNDVSVVDLAAGKETARIAADGSPWGLTVVPRS